jgi:hypothetical protein
LNSTLFAIGGLIALRFQLPVYRQERPLQGGLVAFSLARDSVSHKRVACIINIVITIIAVYDGLTPMKAHELLTSRDKWCKESPAEDSQGNKLQAHDPRGVKWCALGAIQRAYPSRQWGEAMNSVLRALSVSEQGLAQMNNSDKACCLMEWNDDDQSSFTEIREILLEVDI